MYMSDSPWVSTFPFQSPYLVLVLMSPKWPTGASGSGLDPTGGVARTVAVEPTITPRTPITTMDHASLDLISSPCWLLRLPSRHGTDRGRRAQPRGRHARP